MLGTVDPGRATRTLISVPLCAVLSASRGPRDPSQACRHSWLVYPPFSSARFIAFTFQSQQVSPLLKQMMRDTRGVQAATRPQLQTFVMWRASLSPQCAVAKSHHLHLFGPLISPISHP